MSNGPPPLEDDLKRLRCHQEILSSFSRLAAENRDTRQLLHLACAQAARGARIRHAKILCYRPDKGDLLMVAGIGWREGLVGKCTFGTYMASPPGRALQTRNTVTTEDLSTSDFKISPVLREHGIKALLNAPIISENRVWGVLEIDSEQPRRFDDDDAAFLTIMANILGAAIERDTIMRAAEEETAKAVQALADMRTLMREMQHRVKNNFMVINSALMLERQRSPSEEAKAAIDVVSGRVVAIATAHDQLALRDADNQVDLATYLQALASNVAHQHEWVRIETDLDPVEVPVDRATPLGLIANELMTNAIKYAFPRKNGTIRLELHADAVLGEAWLTVADDGIGMGPPRPGSWGTQLIRALAAQIGGDVGYDVVEAGTSVRVRFTLSG